jgi:hypothetical protein
MAAGHPVLDGVGGGRHRSDVGGSKNMGLVTLIIFVAASYHGRECLEEGGL